MRVLVPDSWSTTRAFFTLAENHGVLLRSLMQDDEELEEMFYRVVQEKGQSPDPKLTRQA